MNERAALRERRLDLPGNPRFLLVLRLPLGDTLFATPTIHALRRRYPRAVITAIAGGENAPLLAHNPDLDDTVILPFRRDGRPGVSLADTLRRLARRRYDLALCLGSPLLGWIAPSCLIPHQEFLDYAPLWWLIPRDYSTWNRRHAVELYATAGRHLRLPPLERRLVACLTEDERAEAADTLRRHGLTSGPLITLHAGSAGAPEEKRWPASCFAEVGQSLAQRLGARLILIGGPDEADLGAAIAGAVGPAAVALAGDLSLRQSLAILDAADLHIGNDSGPLHMATAVGTPVVGIYGPTDPAVYGPWTTPDCAAVVQPEQARPVLHFVGGATVWEGITRRTRPDDSLRRLSPTVVLRAALRLLAERRAAPRGNLAGR